MLYCSFVNEHPPVKDESAGFYGPQADNLVDHKRSESWNCCVSPHFNQTCML